MLKMLFAAYFDLDCFSAFSFTFNFSVFFFSYTLVYACTSECD